MSESKRKKQSSASRARPTVSSSLRTTLVSSFNTVNKPSAVYKLGKPTPTFFNATDTVRNSAPAAAAAAPVAAVTATEPKPMVPLSSQTRYNTNRGNTRKRKQQDETALVLQEAHAFIAAHVRTLSSHAYQKSPFSFIDAVDARRVSSTHFVYLNENAPYDLEQVDSLDGLRDAHNYYTISSEGLTHFCIDAQARNTLVTFTPLRRWQIEYYLYMSMMQIGFFRRFRIWKCFKRWRTHIQGSKMQHCKLRLRRSLFILNRHLRRPLFEIRARCCAMAECKLFVVGDSTANKQPLALPQFLALQTQHRASLQRQLRSMYDDIERLVFDACRERLQHHLRESGFQSTASADTNRETARRQVSHAERAAIRTECRWLCKFIKLVDNLVEDALMSLCRDSVRVFLTFVESIQNSGGGSSIFVIDLQLDGERKCFQCQPRLSDLQAAIRGVIHEGMAVVLQPPRFASASSNDGSATQYPPCLSRLAAAAQNEVSSSLASAAAADPSHNGSHNEDESVLDLEQMLVHDRAYLADMKCIQDCVVHAFSDTGRWMASLQPYLDIHFERSPQSLSYEMTNAAKFDDYLTSYTQQIQTMHSMPVTRELGLLRVDCSRIKETFVPVPRERLKFITDKLPHMAHAKCVALSAELSAMNEQIKKTPFTVAEFVCFKAHLRAVHGKEEEMQYRCDEIADMFALINAHKIRVPKETSTQYAKLGQIRSTLLTNVSISDASLDDSTHKFSSYMKTAVPKLVKDIAAVRTAMENEQVLSRLNDDADDDEQGLQRDIGDTLRYIEEHEERLRGYEQLAVDYAHYERNLEMEVTEYERLTDTRHDLSVKQELWTGVAGFVSRMREWRQCTLDALDQEAMHSALKHDIKLVGKCSRHLSATAEHHECIQYLKRNVMQLKQCMPLVQHLSSPCIDVRHWSELAEKLDGYDVGAEIEARTFTLGTIYARDLLSYEKEISAVAVQAAQEQSLLELLQKVQQLWKECDMPLQAYKDCKHVYILGNLDELMANLDESLVTIATITSSRYVAPIADTVGEWQKKLVLFQDTLDEWITMQRKWMYLETIFGGGDIAKQLPSETALFAKIDKYWRESMLQTYDNPDAMACGTYSGRKETMCTHNASLDRIEKSLEEYLETKRQIFPRFYFLSNDELLEILADSRNPRKVEPHLRKCFDNVYKLELAEDKSVSILSMISGEGERVALRKPVKIGRKPVEEWLCLLEAEMKKSIKQRMQSGVADYENEARTDWIMTHCAQIVMSVSQIEWCMHTELAIEKHQLSPWLQTNVAQIDDSIVFVRGSLKRNDRKKMVALVTTDVHCRDVVQTLLDTNCESVMDFNWQKQLRFYWDFERHECRVRQISADLNYGYEYQGISSRLVITPLTDRCWITVTGALHIKLGASPAGPAGTGKTESVKDLAKGLGIQCVVYNCSDQIDYKMMSKLFSGLAQTGSWTCLDEFNRIQIEVLSVVAQQLLCIRQALLANLSTFNFNGQQIRLSTCFGVNITMNPGYAGRTPLPDNLKVLFRPVAMMIPDYGLIAEIMLFAEGFSQATALSKKMVKLYKLSSEQLSQQDHYDFGMRAVKSVLVMAGSLKRAQPDVDESVVLIRAMRDSNVPKFLTDDLPLFNAIVSDLFPSAEIVDNDYGQLQQVVVDCCRKRRLQPEPCFVTKIVQLFDTFDVRFGVMLVGPTGGGKTEIYNVLADAMTALREQHRHPDERFQAVHLHVLNPKSISMGELYGEMNLLTQEWTDGLASSIMRQSIRDTSPDRHWVVFDGPVDTLWIESLNTVLDDNMTLCLANGERIKLKPELRMLFEVLDLAVASPATVSRCGMVYVPSDDLGVAPFIRTFFSQLQQKSASGADHGTEAETDALFAFVLQLFLEHMPVLIAHKRELQREGVIKVPMASPDISLASSACHLFESLYTQHQSHINTEIATKLFVFCAIWSVGGNIDGGRHHFSEVVLQKFANVGFPKFPENNSNNKSDSSDQVQTVFDFNIDVATNHWVLWKDYVADFRYEPGMKYTSILVPTLDTFRYSYLTELLFGVHYPVFLTGDSGVGKTQICHNLIEKLKTEKNVFPVVLNFSAQTSAKAAQFGIEKQLQKRSKTKYGGPSNKKVLLYIDDINMPTKEEFGAQPPIELLRQLQDYGGFYDRDKWFFKQVVDASMICSAAPPGGGRSELTERFIRHFNILCVPKPSTAVLTQIFCSILGGHMAAHNFKSEIQSLCTPTVLSTIDLYTDISQQLLPIPAKSHYTFNLRDISKVFQGILMCSASTATDKAHFTRLWMHESMRCFHDRLICDEDRQWFADAMMVYLRKHFKISSWDQHDLFVQRPIVWGDFFKGASDRSYAELTRGPGQRDQDHDEDDDDNDNNDAATAGFALLSKILTGYLDDYNMDSSAPMNLVFFDDAMKHLLRIARILRQPRGNAMLVGVGGSGRQSLSKLACFILEYECVQIELRRGYDYYTFRDDMKELMLSAGGNGKHTVFLFNDTQIIDERFLEDINNLLNSGEIPNLFAATEDLQRIDELLHPFMKDHEIAVTPDSTWQTFVSRIRDHLHLVLCFSPVGDAFRQRCRMFPSLINCCTIDWYSKWPSQALLSVSNKFLSELNDIEDDTKGNLSRMCERVHSSVQLVAAQFFEQLKRRVYTTPKSYLDMIQLYMKMLTQKRDELGSRRRTLYTGLQKLEEANAVVATLQMELKKLQPQLAVKQTEATQLLETIAVDQSEADKVKAKVEAEAKIVQKQAEETSLVQQDAQKDLDKALPALEAASKALSALNKSDITEVKGMAKPPAGVVKVLEAVMILLGEKTAWDHAKKIMAGANFLKTLKEFDKDNIANKAIQLLKKKYISDSENFSVERMQKVSVAATALCKWVHAMVLYSEVAATVEPKRQRLAQMNAQLQAANAELQLKQDALQTIIDKVTSLKKQCDVTLAEKKKLEFESDQCMQRLSRAEKLTVGLAEEQIRWKEQEQMLGKEIQDLVGDVFISSAFVSYAAPFTGPFREQLVSTWMSSEAFAAIPHTAIGKFSFIKTFGNPLEIATWNAQGLPTDEVSIQSAMIAKLAERWPLMIDPQNQSKQWIKNMEKRNGLRLVKLDDPNLLRVLEVGIRNGEPVLIEDIGEHLDPAIDPILNKAVYSSGGRTLMHLGDSDVDYDENFRFYISTKLSNPHYLPEIAIKVTICNFTVTKTGLTEQLLGDVVKRERPEIDEKRSRLIEQMAADKGELQHIENTILKMLSESTGNILDDVALIDTLESSKKTSAVINQRVAESEKTERMIEDTRSRYHCVAKRGSIIFFVIADMALIDPMYQYSLTYFSKLFNSCIDQSEQTDDLQRRLQILQDNLTFWMYSNICRGLFERHKLIFSFLICANILLDAKQISPAEWMFFLRGATNAQNKPQANEQGTQRTPNASMIPQKVWSDLLTLQSTFGDVFRGCCQSVSKTLCNRNSFWNSFFAEHNQEPHALLFGGDEEEDASLSQNKDMGPLSSFQKLMLLKTLKYEKVIFGISSFVGETLGPKFVSLPPTKLDQVFRDTDKTTPIIFVLSTGADPQTVLLRFANDMHKNESIRVLSLGQGQGVKAEKLIANAVKNGDWVVLQNCHLAKSWMPALEKIVIEMRENPSNVHDDFRLWLTSMPCDYFPVPVLQNGVKLTNEPPRGIRANLMRSYASINEADLQQGSPPDDDNADDVSYIYRRLLFSLSFFHAVIQERRKFGALGFNKAYEFNDSDLETSTTILRMFLSEIETQSQIPWDALRYVIGQINYGGRVTDDWDRRCLMTILRAYYSHLVLNQDTYSFLENNTDDQVYKFADGDLHYYKRYIERLPATDDPVVFGMHENANITFQTQESKVMIGTVLNIQPRNVAADNDDKDDDEEDEAENNALATQDELANVIASDMLSQLPQPLDLGDGTQTFEDSRKSTDNGMMDSLTIFLMQEIEKFNRLLRTVSSTLTELKKAIVGEVVMSAVLDELYNDLLNNRVPAVWQTVSYPSLKPLASWIADLRQRLVFIRRWLVNGKPRAYWMSAFFFQQGFITGVLQNHSRKYKIPIDTLSFEFRILQNKYDANDIKCAPNDGVYIYGLYLDGAKWNDASGTLCDANIGELYYKMPIIHLIPCQSHTHDEGVAYNCPVYKTSVRAGVLSTTGQSTNYILPIELPIPAAKKSDYWIKRGVALLTQLND